MAPLDLDDGRMACAPAGDTVGDHVHCRICGQIHPLDDAEYGASVPACETATSTLSASWRSVDMTV